MGRPSMPVEERFHDKYHKDKSNGCWIWDKALDRQGYGTISIGILSNGTKRKVKAPRIMWELYHGENPGDMFVCHHCDNPSCVNPKHLFLGTHKDNQSDSVNKGRHRSIGGKNPKAKLKDSDIRVIRSSPLKYKFLAEIFGVSISTIARIRTNKLWRHV